MFFQNSVIKKYLTALDNERVTAAWEVYKAYFMNKEIQDNIRSSKEEQFQEGFLRELFVKVFGYTLNPSPNFNLITEQKNETDAKKADGAILRDDKVIGVIELKDHKTTDLSHVERQAFGYKSQHKDTKYVVISNFEKLRFYIDNAVEHIEWNLFTLTQDDFRLLYFCLAWTNISTDLPLKAKQESVSNEDHITQQLYKDYSAFKREIFADILANNTTKETPKEQILLLFRKTQKLLDRLLFIFFAEDCGLLPPNSMVEILKQWEQLKEMDEYVPLYNRIKKYFGYMDTGWQGKKYEIFAYNGGLFKPDEVLDSIKISDDILARFTRKLADYDYSTEVDVNILGHIFENSLNEIEEVTAQINAGEAPTVSKRKRDGVFYTPQYITKYIVENTVGRLCAEKKAEMGLDEGTMYDVQSTKAKRKEVYERLQAYREWLLGITICDPACGSGAFLNAALQFLMAEHKLLDEMEAKITGSDIAFQAVENSILENNLYGVDINEESVEIARLALWLRTAKPHRKLNSLNNNIKCGNSLISDPDIAGDKAFNWQAEFPQVFAKGGFDVVIGNPPYVQLQSMGEMSDIYAQCGYEVYNKSADLYCLFTERGYGLLKEGGYQSFIMPNKWMLVAYGKELRRFMANTNLQQIVNFGDVQFFEGAATIVCIFVTKKGGMPTDVEALSLNSKTYKGDFINEVKAGLELYPHDEFGEAEWSIQPRAHLNILKKMKQGTSLKELPIVINNGLKTGFNDAFFIDEETRHKLISESSNSSELIKPFLRGRDLKAWYSSNEGQFMINPHNGIPRKNIVPIDINDYPAVKKHLDQYFVQLSKRADKGVTPYNLRACDYLEEFSKPKIMYSEITAFFPFVYDEEGLLCNNKIFFITAKDNSINLKFLTAIFNSKLCKLWIWYNCPELLGGTREIRKVYFENFCIPECADQQPFIDLADRMLSLNKDLQAKRARFLRRLQDNMPEVKVTGALETFDTLDFAGFVAELKKQKIKLSLVQQDEWEEYFAQYKAALNEISAQISATDKEIDERVYALYGLTEDEIKVIEG